jgi:ribosome-associated heat shock protein Hsp15
MAGEEGKAEVRLDKWLWAARFFKTREGAAKACELGRVELNGARTKPARLLKVGDTLRVRNEGGEFVVEVRELSAVRGPASVAQGLFHEGEASRAAREQAKALEREMRVGMPLPTHKPSKRDRRKLIHGFRDGL